MPTKTLSRSVSPSVSVASKECLQKMSGLLAFLPIEEAGEPGWVSNRYGLFTRADRAKFLSLPADIAVLMARTFDVLRIHRPSIPWMERLIAADCLDNQQITDAYPADHEAWKIDLSVFVNCEEWGPDWELKLRRALYKYIRSNFTCFWEYPHENGQPIMSGPEDFNDGCVRKYIPPALKLALAGGAPPVVPAPGYTLKSQEEWFRYTEEVVTRRRIGKDTPPLYRLVLKGQAFNAEHCVKGGSHV